MKHLVRISDIINDCNLNLCVPTYINEPLSSILKKICDNIAETVTGTGCCYDFRDSTTIVFLNDHNIVTAHTVGGFESFDAGNLAPLFTTSIATPTTTPFLSFNLNTQAANKVFASPISGPNAFPDFRSLVMADMPFTVNNWIQNQFLLPQIPASFWIDSNGRIDGYLRINNAGRLVTDTTGKLAVTTAASSSTGGDLRLSTLLFFDQFLGTPASNTLRIHAPQGDTIRTEANIWTFAVNQISTSAQPTIWNMGGYYPLKFNGQNNITTETDFIALVNDNLAGTSPEATHTFMSFRANRENGSPINIGNPGTEIRIARVGAELVDFSETLYKGDLIFDTIDATVNAGDPTEQLRIKYDGRIISPSYSTLLTAPTTNGTKHILTCDEDGLFSHEAIPVGGLGSVHSVGLQMPSGFSVVNSPITNAGTLVVTGNGTTNQVIRGDGSVGGVPISALIPAVATNSINNTNFGQIWTWDSLSTQTGLTLQTGSTLASGNAQTLFWVNVFGANANSNQRTYGAIFANSHTGTGSTNVGASFSASGAATNIAAQFVNGSVDLGVAGTSLGVLKMSGNASGTVTIQPASAAGTWTWTLPTNDGNAGDVLTTDGAGITSWTVNSVPLNGVTAATGNSDIDSGHRSIIWRWDDIHDASDTFTLSSNSAVLGNGSHILNVVLSSPSSIGNASTATAIFTNSAQSGGLTGRNTAISAQSNAGIRNDGISGLASGVSGVSVNRGVVGQGTGLGTNYGVWAEGTGGVTNYALWTNSGDVSFNSGNIFFNSLSLNSGQDRLIGQNSFTKEVNAVGIGAGLVLTSGVLSSTTTGTVTSIGLTMPSAFTVTNSPITTSGTIDVTGAGTTSQIIRGDGSLASGIPISSLLAATGTNSINNANNTQSWKWDTVGAFGLEITASATTSTNGSYLFGAYRSGAHAASTVTSYAGFFQNTHTGTASTNVAVYANASGGSTNNAIYSVFGDVRVNQGSGSLYIGQAALNTASIKMAGVSGGLITIQTAAAAGTYTWTLPSSQGGASTVLTNNGSGVLSWTNPSIAPQTFQQVLTTGSTLTGNNTVAGGGFNFVWNNFADYTINATNKLFLKVANFGAATPGDVLTLVSTTTGEVNFQAPGAGSSGTVTSFSAGDLSPLFTTSEATVTTTPALTFTLSNAAANTWFGNNTGGSTTPAFNSAGSVTKTDDTNVTLTLGGTPTNSVLNAFSLTLGWTGTLGVARGGTNIASYTVGDTLYASGATTLSKLGLGTAGQILRVNAGATAPEWYTQTFNSGTVTNFSAGDLSPLFTTSEATTTTTPALTFSLSNAGAHTYFGNVTGSSGAPSYTSAGVLSKTDDTNVTLTLGGAPTTSLLQSVNLTLGWTGTLGVARGGTNIASYAVGDILQATGATTLSTLALGTANQLLRVNAGATALEYFTPTFGTGTVTNFSAGDLSPLFTTTEATTTTTPALSFVLTNAGANTYFGNATGGATSPSYTAAGALTAVSDTNIILTAGGNATTSLLRSASITASWSGTLSVARGGTGIASYAAGDLITATGLTTLVRLPIGGPGQQLRVNPGGTALEYFTAGPGITSLNTLTPAAQFFVVGTSGTDFNISSVTDTHTFNIPDASATARGLVTTGSQIFAGLKTHNIGMIVNETGVNSAGGGDFRVESDTNDHALFVDATNNRVGIFTTTPAFAVDITGLTQITGGLGVNTTPSTAAPLALGGSGWTSSGIILFPSISSTPASSPSIIGVTGTIIEATSGNHPIISAINITPPTITPGAATITNTASLFISGAPSATVSGGNFSILVNSGTSRFNGDIVLGTGVAYSSGGRDLIVRNQGSGRFETVDPDVVVINSQSSTTYTLVLTDKGTFIPHTNASPITVTIPTNASVAFPIGTQITFRQGGAGQITFSPAGGVTLVGADSAFKTRVQNSGATITKEATNTWSIIGDTTV